MLPDSSQRFAKEARTPTIIRPAASAVSILPAATAAADPAPAGCGRSASHRRGRTEPVDTRHEYRVAGSGIVQECCQSRTVQGRLAGDWTSLYTRKPLTPAAVSVSNCASVASRPEPARAYPSSSPEGGRSRRLPYQNDISKRRECLVLKKVSKHPSSCGALSAYAPNWWSYNYEYRYVGETDIGTYCEITR